MASQQTRASYRWPGVRFSRKNHESVPEGADVDGNEALSRVRTTVLCGDSRSTPRSSGPGSLVGTFAAVGARKMVFSTFALAMPVRSGRIPRVARMMWYMINVGVELN